MSFVPTFPPIPKDSAKEFEGKIAIIGAGVAGLFAANALKYMGVNDFVVFEASDRFGGRLKNTEGTSFQVGSDIPPLDLGAEWIHAPDGKVVKDMLLFCEDEEELGPSAFIKYKPQWFFRSKRSRFFEFIYQETKWNSSTWWNWLDKYIYRHVQDKVELNSPVEEIRYHSGTATVVMKNGSHHLLDKVICTIPLAVLKTPGAIKFDPPLPEDKVRAMNAIDMPPGLRILFHMKEKFYPDVTSLNGFCDILSYVEDIAVVYDAMYNKELLSSSSNKHQNILAFVAIGNRSAGDLDNFEDEGELVKAVLAKIDKLFDGKGTKNYIKHVVQDWTKEPYIRGAYTFPGASRHFIELGKTVDNTILFAGEHTNAKYHSLVPGAALEGRRAAMEAVTK